MCPVIGHIYERFAWVWGIVGIAVLYNTQVIIKGITV